MGSGRKKIRGFGSFSVREYKAYKSRNPKTGKNI
jgi:integration host factor subunit beta